MKSQVLSIPGRDIERINGIFKKDRITDLIKKVFPSVYLVGGGLRDTILGLPSNDRDYVVTGDIDILNIKKLVNRLDGNFFVIKNLVKIILKDKSEIDITFTQDSIETDISKRDFTINCLVWSESTGLLDMYGGLKDIKNRTIRAVSKENIISDPVRILRAYRLAAEIDGTIEPVTRRFLVSSKRLLRQSPKERITTEFLKILNLHHSLKFLKMALNDGILSVILGISNKNLVKNFKFLKKLDDFYIKNPLLFSSFPFSQSLLEIGLLRLSVLTFGFQADRSLLRLSKKNLKRIERIHRVLKMVQLLRGSLSQRREVLFKLFSEIKDSPHDIGLIMGSKRLLNEATSFKEVFKRPLLKGGQIAGFKDISKDEIGSLFQYILKLQYCGKIRNKKQALNELAKIKNSL